MAPVSPAQTLASFAARVLIVILMIALAGFVWYSGRILLLVFGAILLAISLRRLAGLLSGRTPVSEGWALAIVLVVLVALFALAAWLMGARVAAEFADLWQRLPLGVERAEKFIQQLPWAQALIEQARGLDAAEIGAVVLQRLGGIASATAFALAALAAVVFLGIYLAADPHRYVEGVIALVPQPRRARVQQVLETTGNALWLWLLGQFAAMLAVGALTTVGLLLLGVPGALALGLIAGVLEFVPVIGPIVAAIPAVLIALNQDAATVLYVVLLYFLVQQLEGYVIQPFVQERAVSLPPALILAAIVIAGMLIGILGVALATPLLVVVTVWVKMLYVEDALGESAEVPGAERVESPQERH